MVALKKGFSTASTFKLNVQIEGLRAFAQSRSNAELGWMRDCKPCVPCVSATKSLQPNTRLTMLMKERSHQQLIRTWQINEHIRKFAKQHPTELFFDAHMPKGIAKCRRNCRISGAGELKTKPQRF